MPLSSIDMYIDILNLKLYRGSNAGQMKIQKLYSNFDTRKNLTPPFKRQQTKTTPFSYRSNMCKEIATKKKKQIQKIIIMRIVAEARRRAGGVPKRSSSTREQMLRDLCQTPKGLDQLRTIGGG
jgi:hypothetical protein